MSSSKRKELLVGESTRDLILATYIILAYVWKTPNTSHRQCVIPVHHTPPPPSSTEGELNSLVFVAFLLALQHDSNTRTPNRCGDTFARFFRSI